MDKTKREILEEVAEQVDGTLQPRYSGRGMFGAECLSIYCDDHVRCIEQASARGITGARYDNMGKGMVVYWPHIKE